MPSCRSRDGYGSNFCIGVAYRQEENFTTQNEDVTIDGQPCPGIPTLTDIDGNIYNTVQIGQQSFESEVGERVDDLQPVLPDVGLGFLYARQTFRDSVRCPFVRGELAARPSCLCRFFFISR